MVSQASLDCSPQENVSQDCMFRLGPTNLGNKDEDFSILSCSQEHTTPQMPVKKTRQWAAWTRQEEESFFAALQQVGKNFEKITCHVQSKNKDQVRHYYYRLVRRMNKLLGPELCLDAKNSKDTNAAMLRWWSLLEKYSCKASKLHLKPRRFKIFVETLENQLLRDRKKSIKRRVSTGLNNSSILSIPASYQIRPPRPEINAVKAVLVDGQNIKKVRNGALFKRPVNIGTGRANYKIDPSAVRTSNHRRRTAAYKRWERAAIAGVSLVADAAEHLERVDTDKEIDNVQETSGPAGSQLVDKVAHSLQPPPHSLLTENCIQNSSKLKLQLFPVDECTRRVLEMDNHNPHLELTLSTKKKISSVIEHLNRKWQNSSSQSQELLLFPFWAQGENLMGYQKWTMDSPLCAADIYYLIGSPPIFRLRYGWFSRDKVESVAPQASSSTISEKKLSISRAMGQNAKTANASDSCNKPLVSSESISPSPSSSSTPNKRIECGLPVSELNTCEYHDGAVVASPAMEENGDVSSKGQAGNKSLVLSAGQWADSLTNVSIGDLISESEAAMDMECREFPTPLIPNGLHHMPFTCDSFDAAIAAHIHKYQNRSGTQQGLVSRISSIWDAEETCDAFSFQGVSPFNVKDHSSSMAHNLEAYTQLTPASPSASHEVEEVPEVATATSSDCPYGDLANGSSPDHRSKPDRSTKDHGGPTDSDCPYEDLANDSSPDHPLDHSMKDLGGLTDIYWPDSLGLLDLDVPSCRYSITDLILTDSLNGMNRLVATSLDAFQSCSFFGLEKKESGSTSEACQTFSLSDFKI